MAHKYAQIAFTKTVREIQTLQNSRNGYASMDKGDDYNDCLSANEADFISLRDSFYMASVSETKWPYVQHRGGPQGFVKVIDEKTLGFSDYKGNRQYVSNGNVQNNDRVSLFFMDYPNRRRLKLFGRIRRVAEDDWQTLAALEDGHYRATIERAFVIDIEAFDWNCPQHITPRYSEAEIETIISPLQHKITELQTLLSASAAVQYPASLGDGDLALVISAIRQLSPSIKAIELREVSGQALPAIAAGAHIEVPVQLSDGRLVWRHYSISSNPNRRDIYEIAVKVMAPLKRTEKQKADSASNMINQYFILGLQLNCRQPNNYFKLVEQAGPTVLIAAGIGITAIKSMALSLASQKRLFELHYVGKSLTEMAFQDRLVRQFGQQCHLYCSSENNKLNIMNLLQQAEKGTHFYLCGPQNMIDEYLLAAEKVNIPVSQIHYEKFSGLPLVSDKAIEIKLINSQKNIEVAADQSILQALLAAGIDIPYSCLTGRCKSCVVQVVAGDVEHRDSCLSVQEKQQKLMCLCVSRAKSNQLAFAL